MGLGIPKSRPWWWYLGPGFLVSVGYMDPGNWATSLEAGSRYGYSLLFVVTLASAMAVLFQALAAKLGVATGQDLAEHLRARYPGRFGRFLFLTALLAMVATDLAEFMGMAVALNLLFGLPLVLAAWLTVLDVFLILRLERFGFRAVEGAIAFLVGVIGLATWRSSSWPSLPSLASCATPSSPTGASWTPGASTWPWASWGPRSCPTTFSCTRPR